MRKLVITQNITVDGAIEMLGDWFDPQLARRGPARGVAPTGRRGRCVARRASDVRGLPRLLAQPDRRRHRRHRLSEPGRQVRGVLDDDRSRSGRTRPCWPATPSSRLTKLKAQPGKDIVLTGSISLGARADRRGAGRRIPAVRLSDGAGQRTAAVPRRRRDSATHPGRTAESPSRRASRCCATARS